MSLLAPSEHHVERDYAGAPTHRDDAAATQIPAFRALGLPRPLLEAIVPLGFREPTQIQSAAIPALLIGQDVTGVAQTGTGKTAAFGLPLLASLDPAASHVQALVLVPTRELAIQVADALVSFSATLPGVAVTAIYGGSSMGRQITALRRGSQVVVGTPGRVIDLIERKVLNLETVRFAVLDEADEMLRMGFAEDVDTILGHTPQDRQTALFSATMPPAIRRVANSHLRKPVDVSVAASATPVSAIEQSYAVLRFSDKSAALQRVLAVSDAAAKVVFVRTRSACEELGTALLGAGVKAAVISGDVTQIERERTIDRLRHGHIDVLVATDVAARGMDVERIGLVVNFDAPADPETYVHRVGRTGRAGRSGEAITFFTPKELSKRKAIEHTIGRRLVEVTVPTATEVRDRQAARAIASAVERHAAGRLGGYKNLLRSTAEQAGLSVEDVAAALIATVISDDGTPLEEPNQGYKPRHREGGSRDFRDGETSRRDTRDRAAGRYDGRRGASDAADTRGYRGKSGYQGKKSDRAAEHAPSRGKAQRGARGEYRDAPTHRDSRDRRATGRPAQGRPAQDRRTQDWAPRKGRSARPARRPVA